MLWQPALPDKYTTMTDDQLAAAIGDRKAELGDRLVEAGDGGLHVAVGEGAAADLEELLRLLQGEAIALGLARVYGVGADPPQDDGQ